MTETAIEVVERAMNASRAMTSIGRAAVVVEELAKAGYLNHDAGIVRVQP